MALDSIVYTLLIGLIAGWIAGLIKTGKGFGLVGNLIIGVLGAFIGGFLYSVLPLPGLGVIGTIAYAVVGALILLFLLGILRKKGVF